MRFRCSVVNRATGKARDIIVEAPSAEAAMRGCLERGYTVAKAVPMESEGTSENGSATPQPCGPDSTPTPSGPASSANSNTAIVNEIRLLRGDVAKLSRQASRKVAVGVFVGAALIALIVFAIWFVLSAMLMAARGMP